MRTIPLGILGFCSFLFKCNCLKNEKIFLNFLFHFCSLHQILNIFEKKMILLANLLLTLQTVKDLVKPLSRKGHFRTSFKHVNRWQTLGKSAWEYLYNIFWSLWGEMICKLSPLFKFEILGMFFNTLTVAGKYPVQDCENFHFSIQPQLS